MRTILALILREMGTTYGRSPGGYLWAILQPVGMIAALALGFSLLLRAPSLGTSFILFYATGYLPFDLYSTLATKLMNAMKYSKALLAYPKVLWIDTIIARFLLTLLTTVTVAVLVMSGILYFANIHAILNIPYIVLAFAMASVVGLGAGVMNCFVIGIFPVWKNLWSIVSRPMFLASGIFFIYEDMPPVVQDVLWWNPLLHATGAMRKGFYPTYAGDYISVAYAFGFGLVLLMVGLLFLGSYHQRVLEEI